MSESLSKEQELESDLVACQLVIDVIAPTEVRDKMSHQLKSIDFSTHPAGADPVTRRAIEKAISLIELKFTKHDS
jgi:electron transfer flavoprotein alpha/beta subunit